MASVSYSPTSPKSLQTVTASFSALSNATAYNVVFVDANGHSTTVAGTSDGSGALAVKYTPQVQGKVTVTVTPATQSATLTSSFQAGGHT